MDRIDRLLLDLIQADGRAALAVLAERVGLSVSAVNERLRKLQGRGVVRGWSARIDARAAGLDVLAFVHVLVDRPEHEAGFLAAMAADPQVQECHHVTGEWSYLLKVRVASTAALEGFLVALKRQPGLSRSHTTIALSSPKETAAVPCGLPEP